MDRWKPHDDKYSRMALFLRGGGGGGVCVCVCVCGVCIEQGREGEIRRLAKGGTLVRVVGGKFGRMNGLV